MKPSLISLIVVGAVFGFSCPVDSGARSRITMDAMMSAEVVNSYQITPRAALTFSSAQPGSGEELISAGGDAKAARFDVVGYPDQIYQVQLPELVVLKNMAAKGRGRRILIDQFQAYPSGSPRISASGSNSFSVGARREALPSSQEPGLYEGAFNVTVLYP